MRRASQKVRMLTSETPFHTPWWPARVGGLCGLFAVTTATAFLFRHGSILVKRLRRGDGPARLQARQLEEETYYFHTGPSKFTLLTCLSRVKKRW